MGEGTVDVVMTPEMKEKLKGHVGFKIGSSFKYVQKIYREKNEDGGFIFPKSMWPVWILKAKTGYEATKDEDNIGYLAVSSKKQESDDSKYVTQSGTMKLKTLESGILSVTNFMIDDGTFVSYDAKTMDLVIKNDAGDVVKTLNNRKHKSLIEMMPGKTQTEITEAINEHSTLSDEELLGLES